MQNTSTSTKVRIAFFGASVTQQKGGYVDCYKKESGQKVLKFGFGGMHLKDAGIIYIDKVVSSKPDICFIDWFSTIYNGEDDLWKEYINAIIIKLYRINCRPIFLFLPHAFDGLVKDEFYVDASKYLDNINVDYISIDQCLKHTDKSLLLRDVIHTTPYGSKKYAEYIINGIKLDSPWTKSKLGETHFLNTKHLAVHKSFFDYIKLTGNCEIIGIQNQLGRFSGIIELTQAGKSKSICLWDKWCYFTRSHFNLHFTIDNEAIIKITNDDFDTTDCKSSMNFTQYDKKLVIDKIWYIGDSLQVIGEGSRLDYFFVLFEKVASEIKHKIVSLRKR